ncbi:hypothetical protein, partial [Hyalangium rubrum]
PVASFFPFEAGRGFYLFASLPVNRFRLSFRLLFSGEPLPVFLLEGRGFYLFAASAVNCFPVTYSFCQALRFTSEPRLRIRSKGRGFYLSAAFGVNRLR